MYIALKFTLKRRIKNVWSKGRFLLDNNSNEIWSLHHFIVLYKLVFNEKNKSFLIGKKVATNHQHGFIQFKIDLWIFLEIGIKIKFKFQYLKYRFGVMCPY